jgi:drug/metabolite transporter (DMT)-like permease
LKPRPQASQSLPIDATATILMLALAFSWGLNQVAVKIANTGFNPILMVAARSALGGLLVFLWCLRKGTPLFERDGSLPAGIAVGVLFAAEFVLIYIGLDFTTVARGTLFFNTMPFWVLVGAHFLLGERISLRKLAGLVLAFCGVIVLLSDGLSLPDRNALLGDLLSLAGGMFWASTTLLIRKSALRFASSEKTLLYQVGVSAVILLPFIPLGGPLLREVSAGAVWWFLYQAVIVVAVTYPIWFSLIRTYSTSGLASFSFLSPAFGVLCGWLVLGETVTPAVAAALALIAVGLIIVNRAPNRPVAEK